MVWGTISTHGIGRLHVVEGMMNAGKYIQVLDTRLQPQLSDLFPDGNAVLMHDGAPCHRAREVERYLEGCGLEVLPWPGNSPDMNPIEGIWKLLKDRVNSVTVTNKRQLLERIIHAWHHNAEIRDYAIRYIDGMPDRIKALIKAKGGPTKYLNIEH